MSAQATELRPSGDYDAAGARGISGDGQYAVGWLGITTNFPRSGTEAALWRRTGPLGWTTAEPLGHLDDDDNTSSANGVAIDADGNPVVVGWSGENETIQQDVFRQGSDPGTDFIPGSSVSRVFCSDCQKRPFVWTEATGMEGLGLLDDDTKGDATAISADAKTIVGWSGWFASDEDKGSEAVRWVKSGGGDWSAVQPQGLGVFSLPTQFNSAAPDARPLGSVALAVSETGQAIVGYQTFGVDMGRGLSPRFNLAFIWTEALGTGHYLGDVLTDAGVTLGDWVLYTATGVRETNEFFVVVGDGCQGSAEDCLQAFDPPGYIARIGRDADSPSGITTPVEQMISFTELSTAAMAIGTNVANTLTGLNDMAENHRCIRPQDGLPTGWCFFTFGTATLFNGDGTTDGDQFSGDVGLAHYFTPVTSAGASVGGGVIDTDLHWDGSYRANDLHVGGYLAHIPDTGLRLFGAGVWGDMSDIELTRGYLNGAGMAFSDGDTDGEGWGLLGRAGYGFRAGNHLLSPFAEVSFTEARLDGYSETGGPFPTSFQDVETNTTTGRLGILEETDLSPTIRVFGSAAWAHVLDSETPVVKGAVLDIFEFSAHGGGGLTDWAEFMTGGRYQLSQQGVLSVIGRVSTEFDDFFAMQGRVAYSHTF